MPRNVRAIVSRRFARTAAAKAMVFTAAVGWAVSWLDFVLGSGRSSGLFTGTLVAAWVVGLVTYLGARHLAAGRRSARLVVAAAPVDVPSLAWPLVAASLLAPISIHFLVAQVLFGWMFRDFDVWIALSIVLVGHCHIALAVQAARFARIIACEPERDVDLLRFFGPAPVCLSLLTGIATFGLTTFLVLPTMLPMFAIFGFFEMKARDENVALRALSDGRTVQSGLLTLVNRDNTGALSTTAHQHYPTAQGPAPRCTSPSPELHLSHSTGNPLR